MSVRFERARRALQVGRVAKRSGLLRVLREIGDSRREPTRESARRFRCALEELGPTYVKLGQLLSSRPDLLPDVYIDELGRLVDEVPPVPFQEIEAVIKEELGTEAFVAIDPEPLAAASIAQIHRALMHDGRDVVVKVQRPGIEQQIDVDLALIRSTARLLERRSETASLIQLEALADELENHLRAEVDFVEEAYNTELVARLVERFDRVVVPRVIRPYVSKRVLVLERVEGRKLSQDSGLAPELAHELARQLFRAYVYQVVVEGAYHADPHSGNVLLTEDGRLALIDFGLIGRLDADTRSGLSQLLLALAQNRAEDVAELILALSLTDLSSEPEAFLHDVRRKLPRLHWRPLSGISAGQSLADLQRLALVHGLKLPTSFALVGKTLAQADSIARRLDPELDPVALIEDEALQMMQAQLARQLEPTTALARLYTQLEPLTRSPRRLAHLLELLEHGQLKVGVVPTGLSELEHQLRSIANRVGASVIISALLLASALLVHGGSFQWLGVLGFCLAAVLGLYMVYKIIRTPGEL